MNKNSKSTRWFLSTITATFLVLFILGAVTVVIDPLFHYHAPLDGVSYALNNERYTNDGIVRHFEYDAIITGSSMTECFKASEFDELFGVNSVKVPYSGGYPKELDTLTRKALDSENNVRIVLRGFDYNSMILPKDAEHPEEDMRATHFHAPEYLTNDFLPDDVNYVLNKNVLTDFTITALLYTRGGYGTTSFDDYANWNELRSYGEDSVLMSYECSGADDAFEAELTEETVNLIRENAASNLGNTIAQNPDTQFIIYIPPYSITHWDQMSRLGRVHYSAEVLKVFTSELLGYPNVKVYCFDNQYEVTSDLNNYSDQYHHSAEINTDILKWIKDDTGLLTKDNYEAFFDDIAKYYENYDFDYIRDRQKEIWANKG